MAGKSAKQSPRLEYDAIVVGAGIIGTCAAFHCQNLGLKTLLLEQYSFGHANGSSHGHSRITRYAHTEEPFIPIVADTYFQIQELETQLGIQLWQKTGLMWLSNPRQIDAISGNLKKHELEHEVLDHHQISKKFPQFQYGEQWKALFDPAGGNLFLALGGTIHENEKVINFMDGAVTMQNGLVHFGKKIILSAGTWLPELDPHTHNIVNIRPERMAVTYWRPKEAKDVPLFQMDKFPVFIVHNEDTGDDGYGLPCRDFADAIKFCDHHGDPFKIGDAEKPPSHENIVNPGRHLAKHIPLLESSHPAYLQTCKYTMSPDKVYVIDHHPKFENVIVAGCMSGSGFKMAPGIGRILVANGAVSDSTLLEEAVTITIIIMVLMTDGVDLEAVAVEVAVLMVAVMAASVAAVAAEAADSEAKTAEDRVASAVRVDSVAAKAEVAVDKAVLEETMADVVGKEDLAAREDSVDKMEAVVARAVSEAKTVAKADLAVGMEAKADSEADKAVRVDLVDRTAEVEVEWEDREALEDKEAAKEVLAARVDLGISTMDNIKAYGAGLAVQGFDANTFFKKPAVLLKCAALVLGAGLWYCVSKGGWHKSVAIHPICLYNSSAPTCSFGSAFGFFAMAAALALLILDAKFDQITSIPSRKRAVSIDLAISATFAAIFVIAFFTFWSKYSAFDLKEDYSGRLAKMAILVCLLSAAAWAGVALFAFRKHQEGATTGLMEQEGFGDQYSQMPADVAAGYGYGGDSSGIGSIGPVGGVGAGSYQNGGGMPPQQLPPVAPVPTSNPFHNQEGYGY
ncbi:unnamed protein product, partial [Mesorhabditis spiculigera]